MQNTIGDLDRILFHHGLIKIMVQHQLSLVGRSWDELLVANDLGLTQYWPTLRPQTRRKHKYPLNLEIDDSHTSKVGDKLVNSPVSINIGDVVTDQPNPLNAGTHVI